MDPHTHHHHQIDADPALPTPPYAFYASDHEQSYAIAYPHPQMPPYQVPVAHGHGPQTRQLDLQQHPIQQQYHTNLTLIPSHSHSHPHSQQHHQYQGPVYPPSPPHVPLPLPAASPPPPSPDMYDPLSPPLSGSDTSADGLYQGSNSSGANSPASSRGTSLVQRHMRYDPTPSPTTSAPRRRRARSQDSDDDDFGGMMYNTENLAHNRKEATRRQRIEAEQRRRDELRDGYAKLKDVLPVSNQKSSKVSLLDRATNHISVLESENKTLQERIVGLEEEIRRLQTINEKLASGSLQTPSPGMYERPLSPPPEVPGLPHGSSSLTSAPVSHEPRDDASTSSTPSESGGSGSF
ncbi:hypothetical protein GGX14DRAFT_656127 [Mycena pura]|uniref:BHLH domain-containing protein n=1 Tax=Mycena pura TaxID=153505 RepID=A0AAD6Y7U7_9AGAR|nr:hypothetical protein GGX14DRAFT_656127 [Mycena pura]